MADIFLNVKLNDQDARHRLESFISSANNLENNRIFKNGLDLKINPNSINNLDKIINSFKLVQNWTPFNQIETATKALNNAMSGLSRNRAVALKELASFGEVGKDTSKKIIELEQEVLNLQRILANFTSQTSGSFAFKQLVSDLQEGARQTRNAAVEKWYRDTTADYRNTIYDLANRRELEKERAYRDIVENRIEQSRENFSNRQDDIISAFVSSWNAEVQQQKEAPVKQEEERKKAEEEYYRLRSERFESLYKSFEFVSRGISDFANALQNVMSLPGINQLQSFTNNLLSAPLSGLSSAAMSGFGTSVGRFDIMRNYPRIMEQIGFSAEDSQASVEKLRDSILGLPTSLSEITESAQYFTLLTGDLNRATDLAIALNNAFVASGSSQEQISTGTRVFTYLLEGATLTTRQWFSLIRSMPVGLKYVGEELGYVDLKSFTNDLRQNNIELDTFVDALIKVGNESPQLTGILDIFKDRVSAAVTNLGIAAQRFGENLLIGLNDALGGNEYGVTGAIKSLGDIFDNIGKSGAEWIRNNSDRINSLLEKFLSFDWESFLGGVLNGFVTSLERAMFFLNAIKSVLGENLFGSLITGGETFVVILRVASALVGTIASGLRVAAGINMYRAVTSLAGTAAEGAVGGGLFAKIISHLTPIAPALITIGALIPPLILALNHLSSTLPKSGFSYLDDYNEGLSKFNLRAEEIEASRKQAVEDGSVSIFTRSVENEIKLLREREQELQKLIPRVDSASKYYSPNFEEIGTPTFEADFAQRSAFDLVLSNAEKELSEVSMRLNNLTQSYYATIYESFSQLDLGPFASTINESYLEALNSIYEASAQGIEMNDEMNTLIGDFNKKLEEGKEAVEQAQSEVTEAQNRVNALQKSLEQLDEKIQKIKQDVKLTGDFQKLYENGGFLSRQLAASAGTFEGTGLYRNTAEDYLGQAEKYQGIVEGIVEQFNTLSPEDKAKYRDVFFEQLTEIYSDPTQWGKLETIGNDMSKMGVEAFLAGYTGTQVEINEVEAGAQSVINSLVEESLARDLEEAEKNLEEKKGTVEELVSSYSTDLTSLLSAVSGFWGAAAETVFATIGSKFARASSEELIKVKNIVDDFNRMLANVLSNVGNVEVTGQTPRVTFQNPSYNSGGNGARGHATGGMIFAPIGTDIVPAMLTPGEYVHRRAVVNYYGKAFMDRLNNLDLRGALASLSMNYATPYSTGGIVNSDNRSYRDNHASVVQNFNNSRSDYSLRRANRYLRGFA